MLLRTSSPRCSPTARPMSQEVVGHTFSRGAHFFTHHSGLVVDVGAVHAVCSTSPCVSRASVCKSFSALCMCCWCCDLLPDLGMLRLAKARRGESPPPECASRLANSAVSSNLLVPVTCLVCAPCWLLASVLVLPDGPEARHRPPSRMRVFRSSRACGLPLVICRSPCVLGSSLPHRYMSDLRFADVSLFRRRRRHRSSCWDVVFVCTASATHTCLTPLRKITDSVWSR